MNKFKIMAGARTMQTKRLRRGYGTRRSRLSAGHRVFVHPKHQGVFKVRSTYFDPVACNALVVAEEVQVFEAVQAKGWQCGGSNGEGLSRVLASALYPGVLEGLGYVSAADWLNSRRRNFVWRTLPTDRSGLGNGCAVLFLNYLNVQLGLGWDKICQAAAPTLAGTYKALTGKKAPFAEFAALLEKKFPRGQHTDLATDNPFPINGAPAAGGETKGGDSKPAPRSKPQ